MWAIFMDSFSLPVRRFVAIVPEFTVMEDVMQMQSSAGVMRMSRDAVALPTFDLHRVDEALKIAPALWGTEPWSDEQISAVKSRYRRFLRAHKAAGMPDQFEVPDAEVDCYWHTHIAETEQYARDCDEYFGKFFHHSNNMCNGGVGE